MSGKNVLEDRDAGWSVSHQAGSVPAGSSAAGQSAIGQSAPGQRKASSEPKSTYFGAGSTIKGELNLVGQAEIDASCEGEVISEGVLIIGESAEINGDISGDDVRVFGRVAGDLICSLRLELHAGAYVTGSITSPRIVMHDGVVFEGECKMPEGQQSSSQRTAGREIINE